MKFAVDSLRKARDDLRDGERWEVCQLSGRVLYNGNLSLLQGLLSDVKELRAAYASVRKQGSEAAELPITRICAFLLDERLQGPLNREMSSSGLLSRAPRGYADVRRPLMQAEERLGSHYGFSSREVHAYIKAAYSVAEPSGTAMSVDSCDQLARLVREAHTALVPRLRHEPVRMMNRLGRKRESEELAETLCFAVGALVADAVERKAFPLSYFVAITHLSRITP